MKICMIKLGADGDVLRTLPLAKALKKKYRGAEITWVTKGDIAELINNIPYIDKVFKIPFSFQESFDALYNFDFDEEASKIALEVKADKKYGFYLEEGYPIAFNPGAEYYINTIFDDELKKKNTKTYQEMMFELAELPYEKERYNLILTEEDKVYAQNFIKVNSLQNRKIIGMHMGSGLRWPSKAWHKDRIKEFIQLANEKNYKLILFAGPNEIEQHALLAKELKEEGIEIYQNNPKNSKRQLASLVSICDYFVCSDSFSLHVSLALGKKTIALFFVTSPNEIEGYGLLTKIISQKLKEFFPERSDEYNEELVKSITAEEVLNSLKDIENCVS